MSLLSKVPNGVWKASVGPNTKNLSAKDKFFIDNCDSSFYPMRIAGRNRRGNSVNGRKSSNLAQWCELCPKCMLYMVSFVSMAQASGIDAGARK